MKEDNVTDLVCLLFGENPQAVTYSAQPLWSATHDVVSQEINLWKSFDLLLGSNLAPLAPSAGCLATRPLELTTDLVFLISYITRYVSFGSTWMQW